MESEIVYYSEALQRVKKSAKSPTQELKTARDRMKEVQADVDT